MKRLFRSTIWHPEAIPVGEWKYRNLKRVWVPAYDFVAMWAGFNAYVVGSDLLRRLFDEDLIDRLGLLFFAIGAVCFVADAFPRLWPVAMVGKSLLVGMIAAYVAAILFFPSRPEPNWFIIAMLAFGLPLALFQVNLLGEEWKERRATSSRGGES